MTNAIRRLLKQERPFRFIEEEVFVGLQLVADRLMEPWARHLKDIVDLTPVQYNVLRILRGAGEQGLLAGEIGERLITRAPDVTRLIDRLESRRLVRRKRDPDDRRAVRVFISRTGLESLARLREEEPRRLRQVLGHMSPAELEALRDTLSSILDRVTPAN